MDARNANLGQPAPGARDLQDLGAQRLKLLVLELRAKLAAQQQAASAPIAIIGMAGLYPTVGEDLDRFWTMLRDGSVAAQARHQGGAAPGYSNIEGADLFDAGFFRLSDEDAARLDPQQRLLIETAWRAMEDAGRPPASLGRRTGVFVALCSADYVELIRAAPGGSRGQAVSGVSHGIAAGRLSKLFDFDGPSMAVDTACSSSLTAAHLAVEQLRTGGCDAALVGGVSVLISAFVAADLDTAGLLSRDGLCRPFDAAADGYVRGEGCGMLVLKRLADAERDGDRILATIRGSAINNDGGGMLMAPSAPAQRRVMRQALRDARVQPDEVDLVEASSIGAWLADPVEADALTAVYGKGRPAPISLGTVKANIGHLEAAAGVAALTKAVLCLQHQAMPRHATFRSANPHLGWGDAVRIPTATVDAAALSRPLRFMAVSGFSLSGANAHLILERAAPAEATRAVPKRLPVALGARSEAGLRALAAALAERLRASPHALGDLAFTLTAGRAPAQWRAALAVDDAAAAIGWLEGANFAPVHLGTPPPRLGIILTDAPLADDPLVALTADVEGGAKAVQFERRLATLRWLEAIGCRPALLSGSGAAEVAAAAAAGLFDDATSLDLATVPGTGPLHFADERTSLIAWPEPRPARRGELARDPYWRGARDRNERTLTEGAREAGAELVIVLGDLIALVDDAARTECAGLADVAAALHLRGFDLDWRRLFAGSGARIVAAPATPSERRRFWIDAVAAPVSPAAKTLPKLTAEQAGEALIALISAELGLQALAPDQNLLELDVTSVEIVQLLARIQDMTGLRPPVSAVFADPTVNGLVALYLAEQDTPERELIWL